MNKYKLVISDFHIGTGQLLPDGEVNPLEYFIIDARFISFLEHYSTGEFAAAEVELILNGDFLNTLQVDMREKTPTEISEADAVAKVRGIFAGHPELFAALARFAAAPSHNITYIAGNHDPAIHWPAVQAELSARLGAAIAFPGFNYKFDGIWVEHGNQYAPANRFNPNKLFVNVSNGAKVLNLPWGCIWVINYLNQAKKERTYIDRVQPFGRYLFLALFFDPYFAWRWLVKLIFFFIKERSSRSKWLDPMERTRTWETLRNVSIIPKLDPEARKILSWPLYHTVIFGHNHQAAYRRYGHDKLYVNTGTWNDIIHFDVQNLGRGRRLTYAFIDYSEEGKKPAAKLKIWKGTRQQEEDVIF
jgi:UDP-2,3-diacylglucosamine pyrophosphatase LpxH